MFKMTAGLLLLQVGIANWASMLQTSETLKVKVKCLEYFVINYAN